VSPQHSSNKPEQACATLHQVISPGDILSIKACMQTVDHATAELSQYIHTTTYLCVERITATKRQTPPDRPKKRGPDVQRIINWWDKAQHLTKPANTTNGNTVHKLLLQLPVPTPPTTTASRGEWTRWARGSLGQLKRLHAANTPVQLGRTTTTLETAKEASRVFSNTAERPS
jgi:hypothetical protein